MLNDPATYEMLGRGEVGGVFQLDGSPGMRSLLTRFQPESLEHLAAIIAAYRPSMLDSGTLETYVRRRRGEEPVPSIHPKVDKILAPTYGCIVYQESIMMIANQIGGIPISESYSLIKSISKKRADKIAGYKAAFMDGCGRTGLTAAQSKDLWSVIEASSRYAFNKSHAYSYAKLAYQTAYFRCHFPVEFMTALLNSSIPDRNFKIRDRLTETLYDCKQMQIHVRPPCIQTSTAKFTSNAGTINFGLQAIKGVSASAAAAIESAQPFDDFLDFCTRVPTSACPRAAVRNLIRVGAFDWLKINRPVLEDALPRYIKVANDGYKTNRGIEKALTLKQLPPSPDHIAYEREYAGFYITSHPTLDHPELQKCISTPQSIKTTPPGTFTSVGGLITNLRRGTTKRGDSEFVVFDLENVGWFCPVITFNNLDSPILTEGTVVVVRGEVRNSSVSARQILLPHEVNWTRGLLLHLPDLTFIPQATELLSRHPGDAIALLRVSGHNYGPIGRVRLSEQLLQELRPIGTPYFAEIK